MGGGSRAKLTHGHRADQRPINSSHNDAVPAVSPPIAFGVDWDTTGFVAGVESESVRDSEEGVHL